MRLKSNRAGDWFTENTAVFLTTLSAMMQVGPENRKYKIKKKHVSLIHVNCVAADNTSIMEVVLSV